MQMFKKTEALIQGYEKSSKILTISDVLKNQKLGLPWWCSG